MPGDAASFTWTAQGARTGTMTAMLGNGASYTGPFFQVTQETQVDDLSPLWIGWGGPGWRGRGRWWGRRGFGYWGDWGPNTQFVTHYSGKVLANLAGSDGRMRCRFTLMRPSSGMAGGGEGDCQLPAGATIQATFAPT
ncbi:hypothetical protein M0208_09310 [Sphingomonas sp. SUN019]|uniref:hypothetical protein n=1 Tax=Sphingomonas sp. SUN019 TaxID=2937788 RepID=UPI0021640F3E|nr:hypothetical protein [Sphingomonas sp. SUN019]UVO50707.1 hypothetical protein M0208_09310 [Sphingomonas sp. SUN019]